ncbi:MAG: DUF1330 domain-containing protein [Methyloceanibacter sp.]
MKTYYVAGLAMLMGIGLSAIAIHGLQAETKGPIYHVAEIDVTDMDGYMNEYVPKAQASVKAHGGRFLAASNEITALEGTPPSRRVAIIVWDNPEQLQAWQATDEYKEDRKIGDKYATFRAYTLEGLPQ